MTRDEYLSKLAMIRERHNVEIFKLSSEYALSNNNINIGEIAEDHSSRVRVDKISVSHGISRDPQCVYSGVMLTKKGVPFKSGERGNIWQSNLKDKK